MSTTHVPNDLMSVPAAAALLGTDGGTLRRWIKSGRIAGWRVGGRFRVSRLDIEAMIERVDVKAGLPMTRSEVVAREIEVDATLRAAGIRK